MQAKKNSKSNKMRTYMHHNVILATAVTVEVTPSRQLVRKMYMLSTCQVSKTNGQKYNLGIRDFCVYNFHIY